MERSRKLLCKIASASGQVIAAANDYADRKDLLNVERVHFQLEKEMGHISVVCDSLVKIIPSILELDGPAFDERLVDWLTSDEPRTCYETLDQMKRLLQEEEASRTHTSLTGRGTTPAKDKIGEAVDLFNLRKQCFHLLFTIWNNGAGAQQQRYASSSQDDNIRGELSMSGAPVHVGPDFGVPEVVIQDRGRALIEKTKAEKENEYENGLEEVLNWLDGMNCAEKQDITLSLRQVDTCKWLFDMTQYKTWRDGGISFLWLRGKAGAGKSVLVSSVINSLQESQRDGETLAFFYCDFRNERSTHPAEAIRSILSQLLRQVTAISVNVRNCIGDLLKAKERGGGTLNDAKQLAEFMSRVAGLLVRKPLVIIDALDECKNIQELLRALMVIKGCARLFVTSRPLHVIMDNLSRLPFVSMDDTADKLSADIELHVTRELDGRQRLRALDTKFKEEICNVLCKKADGMFRWVQCSIDTLTRCVTRKEVRSTLDSLPEGLDETYERILRGISMNSREGRLAKRALVWLVAALRPLYLEELMEGLSIDVSTRTLDLDFRPMHTGALLDACGSLVTYTERTGVIVLSHFSVKEYLVGELARYNLPRYHINWELAHLALVRSCMCYVSICLRNTQSSGLPSESGERLHKPLRDYVLDHACDHFHHLGSQFDSIVPDIKVLERDIRAHSRIWDNICLSANRVLRCAAPSWPTSKHDFTLYLMVAFGSNQTLHKFLRPIVLRPREGTNPLIYAAYFDKHEHARTLLSRGARLNHSGWETDGFCQVLPIEVAFQNYHYDIVTLFIEEGSSVPLHTFAMVYHRNDYAKIPSPIVRALLQTDDFAEAAESALMDVFMRPLALFNCFTNNDINEQDLIVIIRRVVQVGFDPFTSPCRDTLFRIAAQHGHIGAVDYLLSLGVTLPSDLLVALNIGRMQNATYMIYYLVENGASASAHNTSGDSVLHISLAALKEQDALDVVKFLVARGSDPLKANFYGTTPIQIAVQHGHISVVQYFLSLRVPLDPNLLLIAGKQNRQNGVQMIRYLIDNGVNAFARIGGCSVLHVILATFDEHDALETTKLLVACGLDPLEANPYGITPLRTAVERRHVSVAQYLLSCGSSIPPDQFILLFLQHMQDGARMIRCLVENGFNPLARTRSGGYSLLHIAMDPFHEDESLETTKFLVLRGCDPLLSNSHGETPLHVAIKHNHVSVVQYIISCRLPLPSGLLATLSPQGLKINARMFHCLMENGVILIPNATDKDPLLPIVLEKFDERDALETAKFLISRGCNPLKANRYGDTPLCIALRQAHISVVHYLLSLDVPPPSDLLITLNFRWLKNCARVMRDLIENGANPRVYYPDGDSLLHVALAHSRNEREALETAKLLITHGCDPLRANSRGKTPIRIAVEQGHVSVARYLASLGVPLSPDLLTSSRSLGTQSDGASMVRFLAENGLDVLSRREGETLLQIVISFFPQRDALETTKFLLALGYDPLQAKPGDMTPIHAAIERGHVFLAYYLCSLGATLPPDALFTSLDLPDPLEMRRTSNMVHFLIRQGANVLTREENGDTLLHNAIFAFLRDDPEALEVISLLVDHGCDPATPNIDGVTPLHVAVQKGDALIVRHLLSLEAPLPPDILFTAIQSDWMPNVEMIKVIMVLVTSGADMLARNGAGHTPLYVAITMGRVTVVSHLLSMMEGRPSEDLFAAVESAPQVTRMAMTRVLNGHGLTRRDQRSPTGEPAAKRVRTRS